MSDILWCNLKDIKIYCNFLHVGATALHAQELGFRTILIDDCSRGIAMDAIIDTKKKIREGHGLVIDSHEVVF